MCALPHDEPRKDETEDNHRPWGYYEVLVDESDHKIKRLVIAAGKRLSLQRHRRREEHWFVLKGAARITLDEDDRDLAPGQSVDIPVGTKHRAANVGREELILIEIQTGDYFGEDDIERFADDYGRV